LKLPSKSEKRAKKEKPLAKEGLLMGKQTDVCSSSGIDVKAEKYLFIFK
jgi:hypothetical protein